MTAYRRTHGDYRRDDDEINPFEVRTGVFSFDTRHKLALFYLASTEAGLIDPVTSFLADHCPDGKPAVKD
jgi:hypothetical protein